MYTFEPPILYPEASSAESVVPVSTQIDYSLCDAFASGAIRSFFGGFSSTAGYVPGNEAFAVPKDFQAA